MPSYRSNRSQSRSSHSVSVTSSGKRAPTKPPKCRCGTKAVVRTVIKVGPKNGKTFWGCRYFVATGIDCGCGFFLWYSDCLAKYVDDDDDECLQCSEKDLELTMVRRTLMTMNEEKKLMKMKMKFVVVICFILGVTCAILLFKPPKCGAHDLKLGFN